LLLMAIGVVFAPGCTSVLSTASLQEMLWTGEPHAAEAATEIAADGSKPMPDAGDEQHAASEEERATDEERRAAAIDEAVKRLARLGHLDDAARATLLVTLERTEQEDWPAVVEAFAESLPAVESASSEPGTSREVAAEADQSAAPVHVVAKADLDAPAEAAAAGRAEPSLPIESPPPAAASDSGDAATAAVPPQPVAAEVCPAAPTEPAPEAAEAARPPVGLAIRNPAFASRVQAWGVLDRFAADRFRPGQDVIVYFELDGLSAGESAAGHTTCIDTSLRLVGDDGTVVHEWRFEPIAETCRARRRDYFARYVVTIPGSTGAGPHRVELVVTDTLSGEVARGQLPLDVLPAAGQAD